MTMKNAFRLYTLYQSATIVSILSAFGCLSVGYYTATGVLFVLAITFTVFGVRHMNKLKRRCTRIEQGYGDSDD